MSSFPMQSFPLQSALQEAMRLMRSGDLSAATRAIQHGLGADIPEPPPHAPSPAPHAPHAPSTFEALPDASASGGTFAARVHRGAAGARPYKLYTPEIEPGRLAPLIVMLHGCTQDPDDFAAGTRMNQVAGGMGCYVAYPAQTQRANASKCWNWFKGGDPRRGRGEPAILADLVRELVRDHPIDPARVYVAGLSAGGAMAVILGRTYPELFAAVGVHSGLPYAAANDVPSAFAAMRDASGARVSRRRSEAAPIPTIVFHGDCDTTVHPCNGAEVAAQGADRDDEGSAFVPMETERIDVADGHSCTREVARDDAGRVLAEHWLVHGAGHAWSGGSAAGSYTDPRGPDASKEMLRFFLEHPRADARAEATPST